MAVGTYSCRDSSGPKGSVVLYLLSKNIDMTKAMELGLVNFVCDEEALEETLARTIQDLKTLPMETIKYFKDLVNASLFFGLDNHLDKERFYVAEFAGKPLFKQRIETFLSTKK